MSTRAEDIPLEQPDPIIQMLGQMMTYLLQPAAQDATAVAQRPQTQAPVQPEIHTLSPTPEQGWFQDLIKAISQWGQENDVPDPASFPPIALMRMLLGDNPMESVGGPSGAIAGFATRSKLARTALSNPSFENWLLKHGPFIPGTGQAVTNSPASLMRNAPDEVIADLHKQYVAMREAELAARAARAGSPNVRSMSRVQGQ